MYVSNHGQEQKKIIYPNNFLNNDIKIVLGQITADKAIVHIKKGR